MEVDGTISWTVLQSNHHDHARAAGLAHCQNFSAAVESGPRGAAKPKISGFGSGVRRRSFTRLPAACAFFIAWSARCSTARASGRKTRPAWVRLTDLAVRSSNRTPISSSRSRICRLSAGCEMCNFNAARETFSVSATETKYRRCRSSTGVNSKLQMIDFPAYYKTCVPGKLAICHL